MAIDGKICDQKVQYNINKEKEKMPALSSDKTDDMNVLQTKKYSNLIKVE